VLANTTFFLNSIMSEPDEKRDLLMVSTYKPGESTDAQLDAQLRIFRPFWDRVIAVETVDEFDGDGAAVRAHYLGRMNALRLAPRPLYAAITAKQAMESTAWHALDWVGLEFYRRPPYTESAADVAANLDAQLTRVKAAGLKAVAVIEAYSHNYDAEPSTVPEVTYEGFRWALRNKGAVIGTMPFSIARPSGALEYPDVLDQVKRGHSLFLGLPDPGPKLPMPQPPPPPATGPGKIQPNSKVVFVPAGSKSVTVKIVRLGGTTGKVLCDWTTVADTGKYDSEYLGDGGTLEFEDGEDAKTITIKLLATPLTGTWQAWIHLSNPTGGAEIVDDKMRFGAWGKGPVVGFLYPIIKGTRGNNTTIKLRREGTAEDLNRGTRSKIESVSGGLLGTAVEGVHYKAIENPWYSFATGARDQTRQIQLLEGGPGIWLTLRVTKIEPADGRYTVSTTTGTTRLEIH
jgi:hypothetical protein